MARVIVAEDDTEMRRLVVEALREDGHRVTEAFDGGNLLVQLVLIAELFERDPSVSLVNLVVTDVRMPLQSGLDLLEHFLRLRWRVPFIVMSAFGDDEARARAERAGALFFEKPLSMDALRDAVKRLTRHR